MPTLKVIPPVSQARLLRLICHRSEPCGFCGPSSNDAPQKTSAPAEATGQPWWQNDPQIEAARKEALGWLLSAEDRPTLSDEPDPVVMDLYRLLGVPKQVLHRRFRDDVD